MCLFRISVNNARKHFPLPVPRCTPSWLREMFRQADKNGDEYLNLKEILALLKFLNIAVDLEIAKTVFEVGSHS